MIRVNVELVPFGVEDKKHTIGTLSIINDKSGTKESGNYKYTITHKDIKGNEKSATGTLKGWSRAKNVWQLIQVIVEKEGAKL
jgi:hypothetical protein